MMVLAKVLVMVLVMILAKVLVMILVMVLVMILVPLAGPEHDDGLSVLGSRSFPAALPAGQGGWHLALSILIVP